MAMLPSLPVQGPTPYVIVMRNPLSAVDSTRVATGSCFQSMAHWGRESDLGGPGPAGPAPGFHESDDYVLFACPYVKLLRMISSAAHPFGSEEEPTSSGLMIVISAKPRTEIMIMVRRCSVSPNLGAAQTIAAWIEGICEV